MSRIDDLIAKCCPNGVEHRALRDLGRWFGGGTPSKSRRDFWEGGTIPWLSPKDMKGRILFDTEDHITDVAVRGSTTNMAAAGSVGVVVRSSILDKRLPTALLGVEMAINQDMKVIEPNGLVLSAYLAHLLSARGNEILQRTRKSGGSVASIQVPQLLAFRVPVPPLAVQREIVAILDAFTELEAELEARRNQFYWHRDELLRFNTRFADSWTSFGEVGHFTRGRRFTKADVVESGIPSIHYGEIYTKYGVSAAAAFTQVRSELRHQLRYASSGDLVIAGVGETVPDVGKALAWLGESEVAVHDDCFIFRSPLDPKFVAYYMQTKRFNDAKDSIVSRAKVKRLSSQGLARMPLPAPPIGEQERIVEILDTFHELASDIRVGLPAELAARRKQYEYYRDRLLTFPEAS